jgi:putative ABC transport system ATP-binding protein
MPNLSLLDNVLLPMDFCGYYHGAASVARAMDLLAQVDLTAHANKLPSAISGGQQQRVAIARALANDPPLLIADEPTGSLDSTTADSVYQVFAALQQQGKTIIVVSHDSNLNLRVTRPMQLENGVLFDA